MRFSNQVIYAGVVFGLAIGAGVYGYRLQSGSGHPTDMADRTTVNAREQANAGEGRDRSLSAVPTARAADTGSDRNHLANASSPYLLMHADNPVHWYPWGERAFAKARAEQKPIFLSVGYSTCYWCHVMERESFMDEQVAEVLNKRFVNIKVDREQRPAVDQIYMNALHLMGQRGGWPMSMFITPELEPFIGGTYFPKEHFLRLLDRIDQAWHSQRPSVRDHANKLAGKLQQVETMPVADKVPGNVPVKKVATNLRDSYDKLNAGFGNAPKFPQPAKLNLLLTRYQQTGDEAALNMVIDTLDAMARGGIYDHVGRGFHRYSTDDQWSIPHFEKMLYDNAQLMFTYARAYEVTGGERHKRMALEIAAYVERMMTGEHDMFYSAMDSETDHEEGAYYVWTKAQIRELLDEAQYQVAEIVYGLNQPPNFDDRYVLQWVAGYQATADELGLSVAEMFSRLEPIRDSLLAAREQRKKPLVDDKVIVAWNGLMIDALAYTGARLDEPRLIRRAAAAADALWRHLRRDGELLHVYRQGEAKLPAYLDDYAAYILALMALHETDGGQRWLDRAVSLADAMVARLWDSDGAFFYAQAGDDSLLIRTKGGFDGAVPSGNSLATMALLELVEAGQDRFLSYLAGTFKAFAARLERHPQALTTMTEALSRYHAGNYPREVAMPNVTIDRLRAVAGNDSLPASGGPAGQSLKSDRHVRLRVNLKHAEVDAYRLQARFDITDGWHINANPASLEFLIPTTLQAEVDGRRVEPRVQYPAGTILETGLAEPIAVYGGRTEIPFEVPLADTEADQLRILARVQACNDSGRCLLPATIAATVNPAP